MFQDGFNSAITFAAIRFFLEEGLLDDSQRFARIDCLAFGDTDFSDFAGFGRKHFVLHFHRFDNQHALIGGDIIARAEQHAHDFAGHGRNQIDSTRRSRAAGCAVAPSFFVVNRNWDSLPVDDDFSSSAGRGFQCAAVDAIVQLHDVKAWLRLTDSSFVRLLAEFQLRRAVGGGEFRRDGLPVKFKFEFQAYSLISQF